jgi:hypothetical protein
VSQTDDILNHLRAGHALTPLEALQRFGVFRCAARILELRQCGYSIETDVLQLPNGKHIASYRMVQ